MLAGVCAGLALKWNMDVTLVRIAAVAASMVYGIGLIAYIVDWIRFPERLTETKRDHQQERLAELWRQERIRDQQRIAQSSSDPLSFLRAPVIAGLHRQRFAIAALAGLGMLATFLPWGHFPIIGSISGDAGEVGWTTLCCFIPAIVLALAGAKFEPLIGIARLAAAIPAGIAGSIGLYEIYQFKSIANRSIPTTRLRRPWQLRSALGSASTCWSPQALPLSQPLGFLPNCHPCRMNLISIF